MYGQRQVITKVNIYKNLFIFICVYIYKVNNNGYIYANNNKNTLT